MRTLIWTGAIAIIVTASGVVAGQKPSHSVPTGAVTTSTQLVRVAGTLNPTAVLDRILSFDANADNRISRDELPERMEGLVRRGDLNKDGFLTPNEIVLLVDVSSAPRQSSRGNAHVATSLADVIADLKLPPATYSRALAIANATRDVNSPPNIDAQTEMKNLLGDEDYENYVAAIARLRSGPTMFIDGVVAGIPARPR